MSVKDTWNYAKEEDYPEEWHGRFHEWPICNIDDPGIQSLIMKKEIMNELAEKDRTIERLKKKNALSDIILEKKG